jgi:spermidine synthase
MNEKNQNSIKLLLIALGFISFITQIVFMRELYCVFSGNELVFGLVMGIWLLLSGLGALLGHFIASDHISLLKLTFFHILISLLPLISLALLYLFPLFTENYGADYDLNRIFLISTLLLLLFALLNGYLFVLYSGLYSVSNKENKLSKAYVLEVFGSVTGAVALIAFFNSAYNSGEILFFAFILNLFILILFFIIHRKRHFALILFLLFVFLIRSAFFSDHVKNFEKKLSALYFKNQELISEKNSPYGKVSVSRSEDQYNFFVNRQFVFTSFDPVAHEERIHFPVALVPDPKDILVVSGGFNSVHTELKKYGNPNIDYVEKNIWLIRLESEYMGAMPEEMELIQSDPVSYLDTCTRLYDAIILNIPMPLSLEYSSYYSLEFYEKCKKCMSDSSVLTFKLDLNYRYLNHEERKLFSGVYNTISAVFDHVRLIPASGIIVVASDRSLDKSVLEALQDKGIDNAYVGPYYFHENRLIFEERKLLDMVDVSVEINRDFKPVLFRFYLDTWMRRVHSGYGPVFILLLIILVFLWRKNPLNLGLFGSGLAGSSLELTLIFSFQIMVGGLYLSLNMIIMLFMLGIAIGAYLIPAYYTSTLRRILTFQVIIALYCILLPLLLFLIHNTGIDQKFMKIIFYVLAVDSAILIGGQFAVISRMNKGRLFGIASSAYSADLFGAALGAMFISAILIPALGIFYTALICGIMNICIALYLFWNRKCTDISA